VCVWECGVSVGCVCVCEFACECGRVWACVWGVSVCGLVWGVGVCV